MSTITVNRAPITLTRNDQGRGHPKLGQIVRHFRKARFPEMTIKQYADKVGLNESFLRRVEKGERGLSVASLAKLVAWDAPDKNNETLAEEYLICLAAIQGATFYPWGGEPCSWVKYADE